MKKRGRNLGKYFGTDGFRGAVNQTLTCDHAYSIGKYLGFYARKNGGGKIVIGKDTRRSSYMFEYALSAGIVSVGSNAYLLHVTTTASVSFVTRTENFDFGVMITASHNPFCDNGIKIFSSSGEKLDEKIISSIENYLDGGEKIPLSSASEVGRTVDYIFGRNRYVGYLISMSKNSYKNKRVGLDCANGSAWAIAKSVFDALGAKTFVIGAQPNGYNINENCGSLHTENLCEIVRENGLDVAFAFDGDGDRCILIDERGEVVDGDGILYMCSKYLKRQGELGDKICATVMSNYGLIKSLEREGIAVSVTDVGDKNVYERMTKEKIFLGGERSGHIIFSKHENTGDGIVTAIKIMEVMLEEEKSASSLVSDMLVLPEMLENVEVADKKKVLENENVKTAIEKSRIYLGERGRVLVRPSGTERLIRVLVECESKDDAISVSRDICSALRGVECAE